jgi:hypothetical protein
VTEFPGFEDLADDLRPPIAEWEEEQGNPVYQWQLSTAPGTKVGGHPFWYQYPEWPRCAAGHAMEHLVTVSDHEFDGGTWQRWLPVEEAGTWEGPAERRFATQGAAGLDLGMASVYVFVCRTCPDWPIESVYQR